MKGVFLFIFLTINGFATAQNAVAELKFEEAEMAFNNGDYNLTIEKVNEFEDVLGGMTDKSLYLRIVSQKNLFNEYHYYNDEAQYNLYISLENNINTYLKATEENGLDDKFKEIYASGESLKKLNLIKDKTAWLKEKKRLEDEFEAKRMERQAANEHCRNTFMEYTLDDLPIGLSIEEFRSQYPHILADKFKMDKLIEGTSSSTVYIYYPKKINFEDKKNFVFPYNASTGKPIYDHMVHAVLVQNGVVIGYQKQVLYYNSQGQGNLDFNGAQSELNKQVHNQKDKVQNCDFNVKHRSAEGEDTWTYANKTLSLYNDVYKDENGKRWRISLTTRVFKTE